MGNLNSPVRCNCDCHVQKNVRHVAACCCQHQYKRNCPICNPKPKEGDIAIVTTRYGHRYVAIYTLAPGIDYFWHSVLPDKRSNNQLVDPDRSFEIIGHVNETI